MSFWRSKNLVIELYISVYLCLQCILLCAYLCVCIRFALWVITIVIDNASTSKQ